MSEAYGEGVKRATAAAHQRLIDLLRAKQPVLEALGYPGAETIQPYRVKAKRNPLANQRKFNYEPLGEQIAWHAQQGSYSRNKQDRWLGVDGVLYGRFGIDSYGRSELMIGRTELMPMELSGVDVTNILQLERMIFFVERLLRRHAPHAAIPEQIDLFGTEFIAVPQPILETSQQQDAREWELRCEDPQDAPAYRAKHHASRKASIPVSREDQIRYLFLTWTELITVTGASSLDATPHMFLAAAPYVPGGAVRPEEVAALVGSLETEGLVEWIDNLEPSGHIDDGVVARGEPLDPSSDQALWPPLAQWSFGFDRQQLWRLVLTEGGMRDALEYRALLLSEHRTYALRRALLKWVGQHAKEPNTVSLQSFVSFPTALIDGVAASAPDVYRAARWLATRGYVHLPQNALPYTDIPIGLSRDGLLCIEQYGGDPRAMSEAQRRGEQRHISTFHGPIGNVAIGSENVSQRTGEVSQHQQPLNLAELVNFARAVAQALPVLQLDTSKQAAAEAMTSAIVSEAASTDPDHPKLRVLGSTLRAVIEGAAGNALGTGLLSLWHP